MTPFFIRAPTACAACDHAPMTEPSKEPPYHILRMTCVNRQCVNAGKVFAVALPLIEGTMK